MSPRDIRQNMKNNSNPRYTGFIDILGFKSAVYETAQNPEIYTRIITALTNLSSIEELLKKIRPADADAKDEEYVNAFIGLKVQVFSDCILISSKANNLGFTALTACCALSFWMLFSNGFFGRGAITKGELIHNDSIIFGKSLIQAYELEQKPAIYPRIILAKEINEEESVLTKKIPTKIDFDGTTFLNVFYPDTKRIITEWNNKHSAENHIDLHKGRLALIEALHKDNDLSVHQKLVWLKNYLNEESENLGLDKI